MAANPSTSSLPGATLQIHEELWEARGKISDVLQWALFTSIWLISLPVVFGASLFFPQIRVWGYLDLFLGGAIFVATAVMTVVRYWHVQRTMEDWEDQMFPFFYAVRFELLPVEGDDREKDIWRRYQSLLTSLSNVGKRSWFRSSASLGVVEGGDLKLRTEVKGKRGKHFFNVYARDSNGAPLFVRRFPSSSPVSKEDIRTLRDDVEDVVGRHGNEPLVIAAFAASGFSDDAIDFARSDESLVREAPIDLLRETPSGYVLVLSRND
jgi:hypothetical protein